MLIYVINKYRKPLMSCKEIKSRILSKQNKAKIINKTPFTVQLLYGSSSYNQKIILEMDIESKYTGVAAVTDKKLVF